MKVLKQTPRESSGGLNYGKKRDKLSKLYLILSILLPVKEKESVGWYQNDSNNSKNNSKNKKNSNKDSNKSDIII